MKKLFLVVVLLSAIRTASANCVNSGPDKRLLAKIVCPLQNVFSFRTFRKPLGLHAGGILFIGLPPSVAVNIPIGHKYFHARALYRFDAHPNTEPERGCWEIFPSFAAKVVPTKIEFWKDECLK